MGFSEHMLLSDIGATNTRLALLSHGVLGPINWFAVAEFPYRTGAVNEHFEVPQI
jgi:glucokinase